MLKLDAFTGERHGCSEKLRNQTETQVDPFSPVFEREGLGAYRFGKDLGLRILLGVKYHFVLLSKQT